MGIEINTLDPKIDVQESGIDVQIIDDATGEPNGVVIKVAGPDSKRVKKARGVLVRDRADRRIRVVTADRMEEEARYMAAAAVVSWTGLDDGGKPYECTLKNAERLFAAQPSWQEQVQDVAGNRANFMKN